MENVTEVDQIHYVKWLRDYLVVWVIDGGNQGWFITMGTMAHQHIDHHQWTLQGLSQYVSHKRPQNPDFYMEIWVDHMGGFFQDEGKLRQCVGVNVFSAWVLWMDEGREGRNYAVCVRKWLKRGYL